MGGSSSGLWVTPFSRSLTMHAPPLMTGGINRDTGAVRKTTNGVEGWQSGQSRQSSSQGVDPSSADGRSCVAQQLRTEVRPESSHDPQQLHPPSCESDCVSSPCNAIRLVNGTTQRAEASIKQSRSWQKNLIIATFYGSKWKSVKVHSRVSITCELWVVGQFDVWVAPIGSPKSRRFSGGGVSLRDFGGAS